VSFPRPEVARGAVLGPLIAAEHPSGVGCIAETPGATLTHIRADTPEGPVNRLEVRRPEATGGVPLHTGVALYAGPYFAHFGHGVAESLHRLWAARHFPEYRDARIVFQMQEGARRRPWFDAMLDLIGIAPEQVVLLDHLAQFEELHVPAQGRALGGALLLPDYLSLFPLAPITVPAGAPRRIYISRSRYTHSGIYLGESLIERVLEQAGFAIVHPQDIPIAAFAGMLRGAEIIVFAEGSAIHNLELTGPVEARVMVIARRDGMKRKFEELVSSLAREAAFFAQARVAGSLGWDRANDRPQLSTACSIVPIGALVEAIGAFAGLILPVPDEAEIRAAMREDLMRYLSDPRGGQGSTEAERARARRALEENPEIVALVGA
jgi:Glycosyltransferase 61